MVVLDHLSPDRWLHSQKLQGSWTRRGTEGKKRGKKVGGRKEFIFDVAGRADIASFTHMLMAGTEKNTRVTDIDS
jgi:hypothetical protein